MSNPNISYASRINTTPDQARGIRARAWAFVFDCHSRKEAAPESRRPEDAERRSNEIGADRASIPQ